MTWNKPKSRTAGPWGNGGGKPRPQWASSFGAAPPAVGTNFSTLQRVYSDRRQDAYARYVDRISNAWRTHKP